MKMELAYNGFFNGRELSSDTLKQVAKNFGKRGEVPIVKGHDESIYYNDGLPADGWIKSIKFEEKEDKGYLLADEFEIFEPLATEIKEGRYKNWSIGIARERTQDQDGETISGEWYLFHLAMLGATLPAIPGLKFLASENLNIEKSEENETYIFNDDKKEIEKVYFSFTANNKTEVQEMPGAEKLEKEKEVNLNDEKVIQLSSENEELKKQNETYKAKLEEFEKEKRILAEKRMKEIEETFSSKAKEKAINEELISEVLSCETKENFLLSFNKVLDSIKNLELDEIPVFKEKEKEEEEYLSLEDAKEKQRKQIL